MDEDEEVVHYDKYIQKQLIDNLDLLYIPVNTYEINRSIEK